MKCPWCKDDRAYLGFHIIECMNAACKYFSADWIMEAPVETVNNEPEKNYNDSEYDLSQCPPPTQPPPQTYSPFGPGSLYGP